MEQAAKRYAEAPDRASKERVVEAERSRREDEEREAKGKEMELKMKLPLWAYAKRRLDACGHSVAWLEVQDSSRSPPPQRPPSLCCHTCPNSRSKARGCPRTRHRLRSNPTRNARSAP